jgi:excisionase family DNA binding protein
MDERHLTLSDVAGLMGVSERTVRRWIKSGKLKAYKPGRDYRIPESSVRAFVEGSEISPKALRRSALEPSLFNGLEDERRPYDFRAAATGLHRYCSHWERKLRENDFDYQALKEFFVAVEHWHPILQTALDTELNELMADTELSFSSELLARSEIWQACDRYIELGVSLANAGNERFDTELEEEQRRAEKRRAAFTVYAGGLSA